MFKCLSKHRGQVTSQPSLLMFLFIYLLLPHGSFVTFPRVFSLVSVFEIGMQVYFTNCVKWGSACSVILVYTELSQKYFCHYRIFLLLVINIDSKFSSDLYFQRQNLPPADIIFISESLNYYLASECMKTLFSELRPFGKVILIIL